MMGACVCIRLHMVTYSYISIRRVVRWHWIEVCILCLVYIWGMGTDRDMMTVVDADMLLTSSPRLKPGDSLVLRQGFPEGTCSPPTEVLLRRFEGPRRRVPPVRRIGCFWRR